MRSVYTGYCTLHFSLLFKLNNFLRLALFCPGINNIREEKLKEEEEEKVIVVCNLSGSSKMQSTFFAF